MNMSYARSVALLPRLMDTRSTEDYCCGPTMLKQLIEQWGLRPIEKGHRLTVYDRVDVDAAIERKKIAQFVEDQR